MPLAARCAEAVTNAVCQRQARERDAAHEDPAGQELRRADRAPPRPRRRGHEHGDRQGHERERGPARPLLGIGDKMRIPLRPWSGVFGVLDGVDDVEDFVEASDVEHAFDAVVDVGEGKAGAVVATVDFVADDLAHAS